MADDGMNGGAAVSDDDRKLFAGGLPQEATESDIREYFGTYGTVTSVNLKMDQMTGRSRGFAFVVFDSVETLNGVLAKDHVIKGKKVAVKKAASKQGKIYVGKFTAPISEEEIKSHFSQFGSVVEIQRPVDRSKNNEPKNFCFITFEKEETANNLLKRGQLNLNGQDVEIKKVTVKTDMGGMGGGMRGGGRGGMRGGRGGQGGWGGPGGGYDAWGYGGGWGDYGAPAGPWGYGGGYGGYGGGQAGGWGGDAGGYGGGGKMGGNAGGGMGGGYGGGRGRGGGRGGRAAPY